MRIQTTSSRAVCATALMLVVTFSVARADSTFTDANWISLNPRIPATCEEVSAVTVDSLGNLYIGGYFSLIADVTTHGVAKWDGSRWSALGSGIDGQVLALAVSGSDLYAAGNFMGAANNVAKWDGSSWSALASGIDGSVQALAVSGSNLYAGGVFTTAGGNPAGNIARWDGSRWSALGSGMDGAVLALAVSGTNVYAGGFFTHAGGNAVNFVAKWDGSAWSPLSSGMGGGRPGWGPTAHVFALAASGSDLYAGGGFTIAGDTPANHIAKWDGSSWSALGSGLGVGQDRSGDRARLAVSGSDLFVGGAFTVVGGKVSAYVARAYLLTLPGLRVVRSGTQVTVSWPSIDALGFTLERSDNPPDLTWVPDTASVSDDGSNKSVILPAADTAQFFRLRRSSSPNPQN